MGMTYQQVQAIAKATMQYAQKTIRPGMRLTEVRKLCEDKMLELGADSFWYWDVGAFVFAGDETAVSISGTEYQTSDRVIEMDDIITIDLSPQVNRIWGDYARTIILEDGCAVELTENITNPEWRRGLEMERKLHEELFRCACPDMTFEELYFHMNKFIVENGFINLDFLGNLGHSIVQEKKDRIYIEKGNQTKLGDVQYFTFEPHISVTRSLFGYKQEDIYYFEKGQLKKL